MDARSDSPATPAEARSDSPSAFNPADATREAAYAVGPRVYQLTGTPQEIRFFVIGCHGNGGDRQKATAALMNKIAEQIKRDRETPPIGIIFAGDNLYDRGATDPAHDDFTRLFHEIYYADHLPALEKLPALMILGNHDVNMWAKALPLYYAQGDDVGINQAAHTYFANNETMVNKRKNFFKKDTLPLDKLKRWIMPYLFYSVIAGNTQVFFLNSNSYLKDYLQYVTGKTENGNNIETGHVNQAAWFEEEYRKAKAAGRQIFIVQHHPLVISGKRSFPNKYDSTHYLFQTDIDDLNDTLKNLNAEFIKTQSYNELLHAVFKQQNIHPDLLFAAHEHFLSYYNNVELTLHNEPLCQFTSGGGGGDLHERASYRDHPAIGLHQQNNGFVIVTCNQQDPKKYILDVYTTDVYLNDLIKDEDKVLVMPGLHLRYNESSHLPIVTAAADSRIDKLRQCVLAACDMYLIQLRENEKNSHSENSGGMLSWLYNVTKHAYTNTMLHFYHDNKAELENRLMHFIQAYINQYQLPDFQVIVMQLLTLTELLPSRDSGHKLAFYSLLQETIYLEFKTDLQTLADIAFLEEIDDSARLRSAVN